MNVPCYTRPNHPLHAPDGRPICATCEAHDHTGLVHIHCALHDILMDSVGRLRTGFRVHLVGCAQHKWCAEWVADLVLLARPALLVETFEVQEASARMLLRYAHRVPPEAPRAAFLALARVSLSAALVEAWRGTGRDPHFFPQALAAQHLAHAAGEEE